MAAIDIGPFRRAPTSYSLGDLYRITMAINPPTNWELILQALMLPFFMNRQKYRLTKTQMLKMDKSKGGVKKIAFWVAFFDAACTSFLQKKRGQQSLNKCFFV